MHILCILMILTTNIIRVEVQCEDFDKVDTMCAIIGLDFRNNCLLKFKGNLLNPLAESLHNIILKFLLPKKGHKDEVSNLETLILDCLINQKYLNLNYVILKNIFEIANSPNTSIHYGMIIQTILNHFRVNCSNEGEVLKFKPLVNIFSEASAKNMGLGILKGEIGKKKLIRKKRSIICKRSRLWD